MPELIEVQDEVQAMAEEITAVIEKARDFLIERVWAAYIDAITPLDADIATLEKEHRTIDGKARDLELLIPAAAREAQRQADALLLAGKNEEAQAKIAEQQELEAAPADMRQRQQEIRSCIAAIGEEKRNAAKRVFNLLFHECQSVIRAAEHGLFITLLDVLWDELLKFESETCPPRSLSEPQMIRSGHRSDLTAPERSEEWSASQVWYQGRGR